MKEKIERIWKYSCVPLVLLGIGILIRIAFNLARLCGGDINRLVLSIFTIVCLLTCMFLLRRIPKRCLIISSVIAIIIDLGVQLLSLAAIKQGEYTILAQLYNILSIFIYPLYYLSYPLINVLDNDMIVAIVGLIIETIAPLCFIFSGKFVCIEKYFGKTLKNRFPKNDQDTSN